MGGAYSRYRVENEQKMLTENLNVRKHLRNLNVKKKYKIKIDFIARGCKIWTEFNWIRLLGSGGEFL
jgi:hypothetical protein